MKVDLPEGVEVLKVHVCPTCGEQCHGVQSAYGHYHDQKFDFDNWVDATETPAVLVSDLPKVVEAERERWKSECDVCHDTGVYEEGHEWAPCEECPRGHKFRELLEAACREGAEVREAAVAEERERLRVELERRCVSAGEDIENHTRRDDPEAVLLARERQRVYRLVIELLGAAPPNPEPFADLEALEGAATDLSSLAEVGPQEWSELLLGLRAIGWTFHGPAALDPSKGEGGGRS